MRNTCDVTILISIAAFACSTPSELADRGDASVNPDTSHDGNVALLDARAEASSSADSRSDVLAIDARPDVPNTADAPTIDAAPVLPYVELDLTGIGFDERPVADSFILTTAGISGDGQMVAIGHDGRALQTFSRAAGQDRWNRGLQLLGPDGHICRSVSLSHDGRVVAAVFTSATSGVVRVFSWSPNLWVQEAEFPTYNRSPNYPWFDTQTVDLASDGASFAVSSTGGHEVGVYTRGESRTWTLSARVESPRPGNALSFGASVAYSGRMLVVGDPGAGAIDVFRAPNWTVDSFSPRSNWLGSSVGLSNHNEAISGMASSGAYVWRDTTGTWSNESGERGLQTPSGTQSEVDGSELSGSGNTLIMWGHFLRGVMVFQRNNATWTARGLATSSLSTVARAAISDDGSRCVVVGGTLSAGEGYSLFARVYAAN